MLRASWKKTVGYCWRTQKCRNVGLQHAFFEGKKAGETCARKSTSRTLKPRSVDLRPTNRLAALGSDNGRPCNPGMDALLNDGALEFREDTEHWKSAFPAGVLNLPRLYLSAQAQPNRTAVVRTRMPGGVGGAAPRGVPLPLRRAQPCSPICPDASPCPALLSTARLYGDRSPQRSPGGHRVPWLGPIILGYRGLEPLILLPAVLQFSRRYT
jgi:hypothetical protein